MHEFSEYNVLKEFIPGQIWLKRIPLRLLGILIGARMTVIRLTNGDLFIHSPVTFSEKTRMELKALGAVRYVVSPNSLHHLFMGEYMDHYMMAEFYASPGLDKKRPDLKFHHHLKDKPEPGWIDDLDQTIFLGHYNIREVVFFHRLSKTLILADLIMYFCEDSAPLTKIIAQLIGVYQRPVPPIDFRLSISEKFLARQSIKRILEWDFNKIILSHGQIITENGKEIFKEAFSWLL